MAETDSFAAPENSAAAVRRPPTFAIALAIGLLLLLAVFFLGQSISAGRTSRDQARAATEISANLIDALNAGLNAETGQRGYLLTRNESYLPPYTEGSRQWPKLLDELENLVASHGQTDQLERVGDLRAVADEKLEEMAASIQLYDAGDSQAFVALIQGSLGKQLMDEYRAITSELRAHERGLVDSSISRAERIESRNLPLLGILVALMFVLFAILFWLERKAARAILAESETLAMRRARDQSELISRELNHRVKNLFAVIISMVRMTGRQKVEPQVAFKSLRDRIHALSLAHSVSLGDINNPVASVEDLVRATLAPYDAEAGKVHISGEHALIPAGSVTPVGLIFHELATNAVKYGALKVETGRLDVSWTTFDHEGESRIRLVWSESGLSDITPSEADGFGATMISASAHQIGGDIQRTWRAGGLEAVLEFPAQERSS